MTPTTFIRPFSDPAADLASVGGKGASLARMARAELPVPDGFFVTTAAYEAFLEHNGLLPEVLATVRDVDRDDAGALTRASDAIAALFDRGELPPEVRRAITDAYEPLADEDVAVAVRSSATAEDLPDLSFAGQLSTFLNVRGPTSLAATVKRCWASLWSPRAISYRARNGVPHEAVSMAVVVQRLIDATSAGVMFTVDPLRDDPERIVIDATWGLGEALVSGQVSPDHFVVHRKNGRVLDKRIADKQRMTVRLDDGTEERPVPEERRREPSLTEREVERLAALGGRIEALYGAPMDVEWALHDGELFILQARPVTALPSSTRAEPARWRLPKGMYSAMRNNIVEMMLEALTPLFATLGLRVINQRMHALLDEWLGPRTMPDELIINVGGYAYYNGSLRPLQILRIFWRSYSIMKRMLSGMRARWFDEARPRYLEAVHDAQRRAPTELSGAELVEEIRTLSGAAVDAYLSQVSGLIPAAWMSEALFTAVYRATVKKRDDPPAHILLLGLDSAPIRAEKALFDVAARARERPELAAYLVATEARELARRLRSDELPGDVPREQWTAFQQEMERYLREYGHHLYNLDFANPVPADRPEPLLESVRAWVAGRGVDPYRRQRDAAARRDEATKRITARLGRVRGRLFTRTLAWAREYAPLREDCIADVGLGYPRLRRDALELGARLVQAGALRAAEEVFFLEEAELNEDVKAIDAGVTALDSRARAVDERRRALQKTRRLKPPMMLPDLSFPRVARAWAKLRRGKKGRLAGVAASGGHVTAPACVLFGADEIDAMVDGAVLVAPMTSPAWTPLFGRASAIVTDIGGPLSHGSIVAREYGIPAVLGTGDATERIHSGETITVDGDEGQVWLDKEPESRREA